MIATYYFPDLDLKSVAFLKLDAEGYEVEVLRAARDILRRFAPVNAAY